MIHHTGYYYAAKQHSGRSDTAEILVYVSNGGNHIIGSKKNEKII